MKMYVEWCVGCAYFELMLTELMNQEESSTQLFNLLTHSIFVHIRRYTKRPNEKMGPSEKAESLVVDEETRYVYAILTIII